MTGYQKIKQSLKSMRCDLEKNIVDTRILVGPHVVSESSQLIQLSGMISNLKDILRCINDMDNLTNEALVRREVVSIAKKFNYVGDHVTQFLDSSNESDFGFYACWEKVRDESYDCSESASKILEQTKVL